MTKLHRQFYDFIIIVQIRRCDIWHEFDTLGGFCRIFFAFTEIISWSIYCLFNALNPWSVLWNVTFCRNPIFVDSNISKLTDLNVLQMKSFPYLMCQNTGISMKMFLDTHLCIIAFLLNIFDKYIFWEVLNHTKKNVFCRFTDLKRNGCLRTLQHNANMSKRLDRWLTKNAQY